MKYWILLIVAVFMVGCTNSEVETVKESEKAVQAEETATEVNTDVEEKAEEKTEEKAKTETAATVKPKSKEVSEKDPFKGYKKITVDGGNLSGYRQSKVVVDIGFGDREYWAFTNEHGQLVRVTAKKIILQNDKTEPVTSSGRYYSDEAKVPGVERSDLDEGHVIADSLGGVSNAYNITPQDSTLNRHGDQAYMEKNIRNAGGATDFEAIITYANTKTQIPSHYKYTYTLKGNKVVDEYANGNPDKANAEQDLTQSKSTTTKKSTSTNQSNATTGKEDVSAVDTNGNGQVTIQEAKDAGFSMPITRDHWLYQYMDDRDGDGSVGE